METVVAIVMIAFLAGVLAWGLFEDIKRIKVMRKKEEEQALLYQKLYEKLDRIDLSAGEHL